MFKVGLHAKICRPDLSTQQYWSANRKCTLTLDSQPICENENRHDSENLLQQAFCHVEAATSIKIHRIGNQNTRTNHTPIL